MTVDRTSCARFINAPWRRWPFVFLGGGAVRMIDWIRKSNTCAEAYAFISFYKSYLLKDFNEAEMKRLFRRVRPYTMVSYEGLRNGYELAQKAELNGIEGAFVECGVWKGGCAAVMAYVTKKHGSKRDIHLFDSFEGLPPPTAKDGKEVFRYMANVDNGKYASRYKCVGALETVRELFERKLGIADDVVHIHEGWFKETIPQQKEKIGKIAILRLDGDWYESTQICLQQLYDNVVSGGFVVLDDYGSWGLGGGQTLVSTPA